MNHNTSRVIIETMVRKAIDDIRESPKRSVRNLVDMALTFSNGRFQQRFFSAAQAMLRNENSPYYELAQNVVGHVDTERLVGFGMNLGYNGCTRGARIIRETEETQGFQVPWMLTLHLDTENWDDRAARYRELIAQGEALGICVWQLFARCQPRRALSLAALYPDSAFVVYCRCGDVTARFLDEAGELNNVMLAIRYEENAGELCRTLRERGLLYAVYYAYAAEDAGAILSDDLFYTMEQCSPAFAALVPVPDCPAETRETVTAHVRMLRQEQRFPMLPWEALSDCLLVDGIISGDACVAAVDAEGYLHVCDQGDEKTGSNCFIEDLNYAFRQTLSREKETRGYHEN